MVCRSSVCAQSDSRLERLGFVEGEAVNCVVGLQLCYQWLWQGMLERADEVEHAGVELRDRMGFGDGLEARREGFIGSVCQL